MNGKRASVLFITPGGICAPGGVARMAEYCVRAWPADSSYALEVIDTYGPGSRALMPFFALHAWCLALWRMLRGRALLLHINVTERLSVWRKGAFVMLGVWFRVPVILHLHGSNFAGYVLALPQRRRDRVVRLLRRARRIVVLGSYWRDFLIREMQIDPTRIRVLGNAVPDVLSQGSRPPQGTCTLLFLGTVGERKGVSVLLKALASETMGPLRWNAVIAGNGERTFYAGMAEELGIASRITFPGLLGESRVREALLGADIVVLPSRNEGLPVAILEALSYGRPVVATPVGSIPDAVIDGETGLLVPVGDAAALARALSRLIQDETFRRQLGVQARRLFEKRFTLPAYVGSLEPIYAEACAP